MPDPYVVISTIVAGVLGGVGLWWSRRASRKAGVGVPPSEAITNLQVIADTWEERYRLELEAHMTAQQQLSDERAGRAQELADAKAAQAIERELAAQCRGDLDNARSENRFLKAEVERLRSPRTDA